MENNLIETLKNRVKYKNKQLLEYMKKIKIFEDKELIEKMIESLGAQGDLNFKLGMEFTRNSISNQLDREYNLNVVNGIPHFLIEENGKNPRVLFTAHTDSLTEIEAEELQAACGYPKFPFGFESFKCQKSHVNKTYTWHCNRNTD
jgi:hypothetical protein